MHHQGIVHRDLTSSNVLLEHGKIPGTFIAKVPVLGLVNFVHSEELILHSSFGDMLYLSLALYMTPVV